MKKTYTYTMVFCGILLITGSVIAYSKLPKTLDTGLGETIQNITGAVGDYGIDKSFDNHEAVGNSLSLLREASTSTKKQKEYSTQIEDFEQQRLLGGVKNITRQSFDCVLNSAMKLKTEQTNEKIQKDYSSQSEYAGTLPLLNTEYETNCALQGLDLETLIAKQEKIRQGKGLPKTVCPNPEDITSHCRVSEALLTELQGYSLYLDVKSRHDKSLNNGALAFDPLPPKKAFNGLARYIPGIPLILSVEAKSDTGNRDIVNSYTEARNKRVQIMQDEKQRKEKALRRALEYYGQYEREYPRYVETVSISENINTNLTQLKETQRQFKLFEKKFPDATTECDQS